MCSENEPQVGESPDLQALDELIQRQIAKAKLQKPPNVSASKISDSPLSEEILECEFSRKFSTATSDYYSRVSDPVQHIRHF